MWRGWRGRRGAEALRGRRAAAAVRGGRLRGDEARRDEGMGRVAGRPGTLQLPGRLRDSACREELVRRPGASLLPGRRPKTLLVVVVVVVVERDERGGAAVISALGALAFALAFGWLALEALAFGAFAFALSTVGARHLGRLAEVDLLVDVGLRTGCPHQLLKLQITTLDQSLKMGSASSHFPYFAHP